MKSKDRLKDIENNWKTKINPTKSQCKWMIKYIKTLRKALEFYANESHLIKAKQFTHQINTNYTDCVGEIEDGNIARQALE